MADYDTWSVFSDAKLSEYAPTMKELKKLIIAHIERVEVDRAVKRFDDPVEYEIVNVRFHIRKKLR